MARMAPLTPVLAVPPTDYEAYHRLISTEPLLCVTILMIASRYCPLTGQGSASRGNFVHERTWKSCQQLITRLMFGQERGPVKRARSIGSIEALLLLTEWHHRSLHFPPDVDGWESDMIITDDDEATSTSNSWIQDIIEPSRRSDRMSWMLIGAALSLGYELSLFSDEAVATASDDPLLEARRARVTRVLHIFGNHIASRFGCSPLPQSLARLARAPPSGSEGLEQDPWDDVITAWVDLTRLLKSISEMIFPSKSHTQQLLRSGRYLSLLDHFEPLLVQWREKYLDRSGASASAVVATATIG